MNIGYFRPITNCVSNFTRNLQREIYWLIFIPGGPRTSVKKWNLRLQKIRLLKPNMLPTINIKYFIVDYLHHFFIIIWFVYWEKVLTKLKHSNCINYRGVVCSVLLYWDDNYDLFWVKRPNLGQALTPQWEIILPVRNFSVGEPSLPLPLPSHPPHASLTPVFANFHTNNGTAGF